MKKLHKIFGVVLACVMLLSLCACSGNNQGTTQEQTYTIQYTDSTGVHSIEVETGKLYSIHSIPERNGYEFMGLYDAEVGGTQYVNAGGSAVAAFTDNKNIVLYPQFRAKEYTLILDYQGAAVTGSRSMKVAYNTEINDLPLNLSLENKNFVGWYTQPNKQGIQVSDQYGIIPLKNIVNESIFDLTNPQGGIYLYAGFKNEEFTVTFYATENGVPEEVKVEYGTPISEVQPVARVDGKAVIAWSKKKNDTAQGEVFNGKVTSDMVLYAAEYAPVIDFDSKGGNRINSLIARAGDAIKLPIPARENYKFIGWQTPSGSTFTATTMPAASLKLNAKWQAMIVFDSNGGTEVENISEPQGTKITLPETTREGFIFAGWYDESAEKYMDTTMPHESVLLIARYGKVQTKKKVIIGAAEEYTVKYDVYNPTIAYSKRVDFSDIYQNEKIDIHIIAYYESKTSMGGSLTSITSMSWQSTNIASNAYKLWSYDDEHIYPEFNSTKYYESFVREYTLTLDSDSLYVCFYGNDRYQYGKRYWKDFYIEIEYPDMSTLY